jgi:inner membrane protein
MDIVTQGLAGAVVAQSAASRAPARVVVALGAFAGLLADVDVLIQSADDPLLTLDFHRHFTHSLFFVPVGALVAALLAWPFVRGRLGLRATYGFAMLGYLPSGLLDACTSFGTHLWWPLSEARTAWSVIAVVDPLFSLILITAVVLSLVRQSALPSRIGLALALAYLATGWIQRERAEGLAAHLAGQRGHVVARLEVKPTLGNLVLWRSIYEAGGRFHLDAIRPGFVGPNQVYPGESVARFTPDLLPGLEPESRLGQDIVRFTRFSDGFVAIHPRLPTVLGDVRYALLPTSGVPLWGIELNLAEPDRHAAFRTFRDTDAEVRRQFLTMLRGVRLDP